MEIQMLRWSTDKAWAGYRHTEDPQCRPRSKNDAENYKIAKIEIALSPEGKQAYRKQWQDQIKEDVHIVNVIKNDAAEWSAQWRQQFIKADTVTMWENSWAGDISVW